MSYNTLIPDANSFRKRKNDHQALFSSIHRAIVNEVHVEKGTANVRLESFPISREVTFPLLGLSAPPSLTDNTRIDYKTSSWARYIPQVGDVILVGFGADGSLHSLGYGSSFYKGLDNADSSEEATGGINWGETSGKRMKPGDMDFKSSRSSNLYLGDRAKLSSVANSITVNGPTSDITTSTPLVIERARVSEHRFGVARRLILPTDTVESYISTVRGAVPDYAQECSWKVNWDNSTPSGGSLALFSFGDVIEDASTGSSIMISDNTQPVRRYFSATDTTGLITVFEESVDALGNYSLSSTLATAYNWSTNLASWEISNLSTSISSSSTIDLASIGKFTIDGTAGVDITAQGSIMLESALTILFGGSTVTQPYVLGNTLVSLLTTLITDLSTHTHPTGVGPSGPPITAAVYTQVLGNLSTILSTKIFGV